MVAMIASAGLSLLVLALFGGRELSVGPLGLDTVAALIFAAGFLAVSYTHLDVYKRQPS